MLLFGASRDRLSCARLTGAVLAHNASRIWITRVTDCGELNWRLSVSMTKLDFTGGHQVKLGLFAAQRNAGMTSSANTFAYSLNFAGAMPGGNIMMKCSTGAFASMLLNMSIAWPGVRMLRMPLALKASSVMGFNTAPSKPVAARFSFNHCP